MSDSERIARGFDRLAPVYDALAWPLLAGAIPRSQTAFLGEVAGRCRRALIVGGGTGGFLLALLGAGFVGRVVYLDLSQGMLDRARRRLLDRAPARAAQVEWRRGGCEAIASTERFDLICTHYFLDLFSESTLQRVMDRLDASIEPTGAWLFSDFAAPAGSPARRAAQHALLRGLYTFFGATCAIEAQRLPPIDRAFRDRGYREVRSASRGLSLLRAACYRKATRSRRGAPPGTPS